MQPSSVFRPYPGEKVCGDAAVSVALPDGRWMCALVDALGHGAGAHEVAVRAVQYLEAQATHDVVALLHGLDGALKHSRGAAASVCVAAVDGTCMYAGVGNVSLRAWGEGVHQPINAAGIVGRGLRRVVPMGFRIPLGAGFVMHSDGISSRVDLEPLHHLPAADLAARLLADHASPRDDASVLVWKRP